MLMESNRLGPLHFFNPKKKKKWRGAVLHIGEAEGLISVINILLFTGKIPCVFRTNSRESISKMNQTLLSIFKKLASILGVVAPKCYQQETRPASFYFFETRKIASEYA